MELSSLLTVFDNNYNAIEQFTGLAGGVAFHPTQNLMLAVDEDADQFVALDMSTWREAYRLPIGENVGDSSPLGNGVSVVSPDVRGFTSARPTASA